MMELEYELIDWRQALYEDALKSIAANTCCDKCREAALVAKAALKRAEQANGGRAENLARARHLLAMPAFAGAAGDSMMTPRQLVDEQAEDEGLWFVAQTAPEAYLQQELRKMHAAIEADDDG